MYEPTDSDKELIKDVLSNFHATFANMFFAEQIIDYDVTDIPQDKLDLIYAIRYIVKVNPEYKEVIRGALK